MSMMSMSSCGCTTAYYNRHTCIISLSNSFYFYKYVFDPITFLYSRSSTISPCGIFQKFSIPMSHIHIPITDIFVCVCIYFFTPSMNFVVVKCAFVNFPIFIFHPSISVFMLRLPMSIIVITICICHFS